MRRRVLSQNFLREPGADAYLDMLPADRRILTIEVGAGEGVLTRRLAERFDRVLAYEIDTHMAAGLRARVKRFDNVRVLIGDFLTATPPEEPFQVVGNVPFALTSQIVDWCLAARSITTATIITQLEYARKRTGDYGRWSLLTVLTWPEFDWELRGRISREQFRPVPRVDAGVLHITRRNVPLISRRTQKTYRKTVELGFTGVGGSLSASLRRAYPAARVAKAFRAAQVDPATVVAFVTPAQWLDLFRALESRGDAN